MTIAKMKQDLDAFPDTEPCAYTLWTKKDVVEKADVMGHDLSLDEIEMVLNLMCERQTRKHGLNHDLVADCIFEVVDNRDSEPEYESEP